MKQLSDKLDLPVILALIRNGDTHARVGGFRVKVGGVRLMTFATKGTDCICCGRKGAFFRVEDNSSGPHLNLYAYGTDGEEKLMTRDHIVCRSHGGPETVANMSPMCKRCNNMRGTKDQETFLADWKAGKYERGGVISEEKATRKAESGITSACTVEVRELVDKHVAKYGFKSHMIKAWDGELRRVKYRDVVAIECKKLGDDIGLRLLKLSAGDAKRKAISKYARVNYGGQGNRRSDYDMSRAKEKGDIRPAFGILMSLSRKAVDNPTEGNLSRLNDHLKKCKELR